MTPRSTRPVAPVRRGPSVLPASLHRQRLERLESRTLFAANAASEATEAFLIGGEVVSTPAMVESSSSTNTTATTSAAGVGSQMPASRIGFVATVSAAFGRVVMVRVADGVRFGFPPAPSAGADSDAGSADADAGAVRHPAGPSRMVPPVTQESTLARAQDEYAADARPASDASALNAGRPAAEPNGSASDAAGRSAGADAAGASATGGSEATALRTPAVLPAADATASAAPATGALSVPPAAAGLGVGLEPLTDRAADVAPTAAALASAFANPAGTLRDALADAAQDVVPTSLTTLFSAASPLGVLEASVPTLAHQLIGLASRAADGFAVGAPDGLSQAVAAAGVTVAAAGYWQSTAVDRDRQRSATEAQAADDRRAVGWGLTPLEGR